MSFENSLTYLFTQITNSFKDLLDKHLKEIGLHGGQAFVLACLWDEDAQSQIKLSRALNLSPPTINKMVKSLSANRFVDCKRCGADGRSIRVHLTKKGLDCRAEVEEQWKKTETFFFSNLTETEKLIVPQILEKLKK